MNAKVMLPLNGLRLCIDETGKRISGRFFSPLEAGAKAFSGLEDFLLKAAQLFDKYDYPQAFMETRLFQTEKQDTKRRRSIPNAVCAEDICMEHGAVRTYNVIVTSRRNATWQGMVQNEDGSLLEEYGGELELIKILEQE